MPCRSDDFQPSPEVTYNGLTGAKLEAALCGVLTVLDSRSRVGATPNVGNLIGNIFNEVDWIEAGVTKGEVVQWWMRHKKADDARKEQESRDRLAYAARASALAKLTPEERKLLGL